MCVFRIDRVQRSGETAVEQVSVDSATHRVIGGSGTHDGHRTRREQPVQGVLRHSAYTSEMEVSGQSEPRICFFTWLMLSRPGSL